MRESAKPYEAVYPEAVERIKLDFYVDDFLSGTDNEEQAIRLKQQVVEILSSAGFELRKWSSNCENLLSNHSSDEAQPVHMKLSDYNEAAKALGILWYPSPDEYGFKSMIKKNVSVVLIAAKSRVAPIKQVSLPRLELNGALLFTTSAILDYLPRSCWNHVSSKDNPADVASRGLSPDELVNNQLWFQGAPWLKEDESGWKRSPALQVVDEDSLEVKPIKSLCTLTTKIINYKVEQQLIVNFSSFSLLVRSLACVYRVIYNLKPVVLKQGTSERHIGELTLDELYQAKIHLLQAVQHEVYGQELELLRKEGTLRVGGRLHNSAQPYEVKHPIILPQNHRVTELLVRDLHLRNLHAGPSLLTAIVRQQYWIVGCQTVVRKVVQGCMRCVRLKGKTAGQLMGTLPPARTFL
ncbi:uncharacterized protein LOC135699959 [Ochlerotatus camptorhynchus]|uniref:uncharacterized protein LOC135699959 n=1 Tax=Ochlerotatus camptorhynchus TaxID=644619 RepID=UPI0031DC813C